MRASGWIGRVTAAAVLLAVSGTSGCKSLNERYIALEVWKYERCFGHLPPGFVPPGAAAAQAAPPRVCGQAAGCQDGCPPAAMSGCNDCAGGGMVGGGMVDGGMPVGGMPAAPAMAAPAGPGGAPAGITAGKPVVISDELVVP
jgi:hypothetical protein